MKPLLCVMLLAGLSTLTIAQDAPEPEVGQTANSSSGGASGGSGQSSSKPSSSTTAPPPRPAPRAFKPSEEVRADTVLSLPADI